jgi:archaellum component FlaF (FlaF/FlaG flagellin family)
MRLSASASTSGVRLAWHPLGSHAGHAGPVDVLVDGRLVRSVHGSHVTLALPAGLHQISVMLNGLGPRTSTTITVPAS